MSEARQVFHRNRSLFIFLIGLAVCVIIIFLLWQPLLPFFIGLLIAYIFLPIVDWLDKRLPFKNKGRVAQRVIIIIVTFAVTLAIICLVIYFTFASMSSAFASLPATIISGVEGLGEWFDSVVGILTPEQQKQAYDTMESLGASLGNWLQQSFMTGIPVIISTFTFILGFFTLPFFLVFFMTSVHEIKNEFNTAIPCAVNYHVVNFFKIMNEVFGRYFRAQLVIALVIGIATVVILEILGIGLAPALGFLAGVFQLIPTIGGFIAAIIGILVTLAVAPDKVILVLIAYLVINLVISSVLTARLSGHAVNIRAAIVMVLIVVGGYLGGIIGMILIVPVAAMLFALYKYVRQEMEKNKIENSSAAT